MIYLLDANVLIALFDEAHEHHSRVEAWLSGTDHVATCPITEGALMRYMVRQGQSTDTVKALLFDFAERAGYEFWADSLSYAHADLGSVIGYRQVTDAYLVALVDAHDQARLATLDEGLVQAHNLSAVLLG